MSDLKINYYEVLKNTPMWELDEMNKVAFPIVIQEEKDLKEKNAWTIEKGKYVKSFGQTRILKTKNNKRDEFLLLVNGNGILMKDVALYKDKVDDCGCDGNPIATPTDMEKANDETEVVMEHKDIDKESAYLNKKKGFDKSGIAGFFIGAILGAVIMWYATKNKKKTIIGAIAGAVIGMIIGYFMGRRGTKKIETLNKLEQIEKEASNATIPSVQEENIKAKSEEQGFFQLGQTYDFSIPYPVYALTLDGDSFYVATDKTRGKVILKPGARVKGKLVEVKEPNIFVADPASKKVIKIKSKKPLPFLDLGTKMYIPLAMVEPSSMISPEEAMRFLNGGGGLEDEVYVKGRYAGKRLFNLMYMPAHAVILKKTLEVQ